MNRLDVKGEANLILAHSLPHAIKHFHYFCRGRKHLLKPCLAHTERSSSRVCPGALSVGTRRLEYILYCDCFGQVEKLQKLMA